MSLPLPQYGDPLPLGDSAISEKLIQNFTTFIADNIETAYNVNELADTVADCEDHIINIKYTLMAGLIVLVCILLSIIILIAQ